MNAKLKKALGLNHPRRTLAIVGCGIVVYFAFPLYIVATGSMIPTIPPGSFLISCRSSLLPSAVGKGDVLVFKPVANISPARWMHRIVANSGETITPPVHRGRRDVLSGARAFDVDATTESLVVPEGFFYQSGDNRDNSIHGLVPKEIIIGKVLFHFKLPWR